ncbi:MAG: tRNA uridine-5-carboxymethylaminomethyl(34) synthesis enzyme MnmG [Planctomycetota bacterium]
MGERFDVIVIGGGHAGVEAAWAAANALGGERSVALVTIDPAKIGVMSCNPAIGGLAKGQLVREIDALNGLMPLAADTAGIHFKELNTSKGPAVRGPRCQCDKHLYAERVQALIESRAEIAVFPGTVERLIVEGRGEERCVAGVEIAGNLAADPSSEAISLLHAPTVVLTTGTFMRGLLHTGERKTPGGRHGEAAANTISEALVQLGFELGRLKTGTPPRIKRASIDWDALPDQVGDARPKPFSDLTASGWVSGGLSCDRFPMIEQVVCKQTHTTAAGHDAVRQNLHRAPMFSGQIDAAGPRYCPSLEDKVVRFGDRESHGVFLEPESLSDDWVYCNGISTSLPEDVQETIVRTMPGCERAHIYRYGYAAEYDMVRPHQIYATGETRSVRGLYFAGQINGTSGYEEAAAQGLVAGLNAARRSRGEDGVALGRDEAYIGVLMDDLVTRTPVEPYRMFTSRAEHRLLLRADNAADRLTPHARAWGLLRGSLGATRDRVFRERECVMERVTAHAESVRVEGAMLALMCRRPEVDEHRFAELLSETGCAVDEEYVSNAAIYTAWAGYRYEPYLDRQRAEIRRLASMERRSIPEWFDPAGVDSLRTEAREAFARYRPATLGQASRLEGVTPSDLSLIAVHIKRGPGRGGRQEVGA